MLKGALHVLIRVMGFIDGADLALGGRSDVIQLCLFALSNEFYCTLLAELDTLISPKLINNYYAWSNFTVGKTQPARGIIVFYRQDYTMQAVQDWSLYRSLGDALLWTSFSWHDNDSLSSRLTWARILYPHMSNNRTCRKPGRVPVKILWCKYKYYNKLSECFPNASGVFQNKRK